MCCFCRFCVLGSLRSSFFGRRNLLVEGLGVGDGDRDVSVTVSLVGSGDGISFRMYFGHFITVLIFYDCLFPWSHLWKYRFRDIETTIFDPVSVFQRTHRWSQKPSLSSLFLYTIKKPPPHQRVSTDPLKTFTVGFFLRAETKKTWKVSRNCLKCSRNCLKCMSAGFSLEETDQIFPRNCPKCRSAGF